MNKIIILIIILIFFNNCSFDNKTGIWTGSDKIVKNKNKNQKNLELVFKTKNSIIKPKELSLDQLIKIDDPKSFVKWSERYQNRFNYISNVSFANEGNYKKLQKVSNSEINKNILIYNNNLFFSDSKGNIGVFSLEQNQLIYKFNFYKKKLKKTKKNIKLIMNENSIIAADNFGYVYSIDFKNKKLNWAKNFLVPFRSNLKILNNILFLSDEKNKIILLDVNNGKKIDELYTQPSKTVSNFESNLAIDKKDNLLFLSTSGSLYSLNFINQKTINWIQNFKTENEIIFKGNPITVFNNKILVSTKNNITLLNENGLRMWDKNIQSSISPIISGNIIFTINDDNYLILIDSQNGQIIYSQSIYFILNRDFRKNFKKKFKKVSQIFVNKNKLFLISDNSYFIELNIEKQIKTNSIKKNPFNISTDIIFLNKEMVFISSKKIYKVN